MNVFKRLRNLEVIVGAGAAVDEAYKMREFVKEGKTPYKDCKKLLNTGTLDPYISKWGEIPTKYLKSVYDFPVVSDKDLKKWSPTRFEQICKPKLIISGIRTLEAFFDEGGEFIPGIPTTIIYFPFESDSLVLKLLTMLLNSKSVSFWFFKTYSSGGMGGGGGTISPKDLALIPIPNWSIKQMKELAVTYDDFVQSPSSAKFDAIDRKISELYGLTSEEFDFLQGNQSI
jgi:hypothetical protein